MAMPARADRLEPPRTIAPTRLATPVLTIASPRFRSLLVEEAGARFSTGNHVKPLLSGAASFGARERLILEAEHSIHLQTFIFDSDATGAHTAKLLAQRASDGLKVRVLIDAMGSARANPHQFQMMREAGAEVRMRPWSSGNHRWHEKYLITDYRHVIKGGLNIADEYAAGGSEYIKDGTLRYGWRDADILVTGPAVRDLQRSWQRNWARLGPDISEEEERIMLGSLPRYHDGVEVAVVQSHPRDGELARTSELLYYSFAAAQYEINIENAYLFPPPDTRQALIDAAHRGVRVRILTNSWRGSDYRLLNEVAVDAKRELLDAGVEIYESPSMLHSKTVTVDRTLAIVGSANLNGRGRYCDGECLTATWDPTLARTLDQHMEHQLPVTHFLMREDLKRPLWRRAANFLLRPIYHSL